VGRPRVKSGLKQWVRISTREYHAPLVLWDAPATGRRRCYEAQPIARTGFAGGDAASRRDGRGNLSDTNFMHHKFEVTSEDYEKFAAGLEPKKQQMKK
jgi:hypothetical protein